MVLNERDVFEYIQTNAINSEDAREQTIDVTVKILKLLNDNISVNEIVKQINNVSLKNVLHVKTLWEQALIENFVEFSREQDLSSAQDTLDKLKNLTTMTKQEMAARFIEKYYDKKLSIEEIAEVFDLKTENVAKMIKKFEHAFIFNQLHEMLTKMHFSHVLENDYANAERTLNMLKENDDKIKQLKKEMYNDDNK
ncbi:hypothetical protein [Bacillus mycoides]|uniref:hypothetical protein n=1 Tax=Bacillus mycoides TaxID=1405 RepID=UPI003670CD08